MHRRLIDIYDRLFRADQHLDAIKEMILRYHGSDFSGVSGKYDPRGEPTFVIDAETSTLPVPEPRLHTLVGEFLHDVHSALEHLAWQLVKDNGGTPTENTSFPILRERPTANKKGIHPLPTVVGGVSEDVRALIDGAQPYQWGIGYTAHPLWVLHRLWGIDKHRHVVTKGSRLDEFTIPHEIPAFTFTLQPLGFDERGTEIRFAPDDPAVDVDTRTTLRIVVHEPEVGLVVPLWVTLKEVWMGVLTLVRQVERDYLVVPGE